MYQITFTDGKTQAISPTTSTAFFKTEIFEKLTKVLLEIAKQEKVNVHQKLEDIALTADRKRDLLSLSAIPDKHDKLPPPEPKGDGDASSLEASTDSGSTIMTKLRDYTSFFSSFFGSGGEGEGVEEDEEEERKVDDASLLSPPPPPLPLPKITNVEEIPPFSDTDPIFSKIALWKQGDMTKIQVDAIVNAATTNLQGGSGIDGVIHRAAGTKNRENLANLCSKALVALHKTKCEVGEAVITAPLKLDDRVKKIIHTVGPTCKRGTPMAEEAKINLGKCYTSCLNLLTAANLRSICFCGISSALFGCNKQACAEVAVNAVVQWLTKNPTADIKKIVFSIYETDPDTHAIDDAGNDRVFGFYTAALNAAFAAARSKI